MSEIRETIGQGTSHSTLQHLMQSAQEVAKGNYDAASNLFNVTASETEKPELRDLAETLGLMCVKVEAREFSLSLALDEVKKKNAELVREAALRAQSGFLFCSTIIMLSGYTMLLSMGLSHGWICDATEKPITLGLMFLILLMIGAFVKRHHYPWAEWGLTWTGSARSLTESLLFSLPWAVAAIALKWKLVHTPTSALYGHPIFELDSSLLALFIYCLVSITQEIISRGFLQTATERVLTGKYRGFTAIITSSILFAVLHLHYSTATMAATFVSGLFFGWLYYRHRTIVGVSAAHYLLGTLAMDVLHLIG
jgi:membrane protease YdiL (CAAX protease family)